jgi:sugar-specific transcriptional regulator TrmB
MLINDLIVSMITVDKLQLFGLVLAEAQIYNYLLQEGQSSASQISKAVKVGRTNVYDYVKNLEQLGLVKQLEKHNRLFFEAESPLRLKELGERKIAQNRNLVNMMEELLPKLAQEYYKQQNLPLITYLSGEKGFESFNMSLYLQGATTEIFYFINNLDKYLPPEPKYRFAIQKKNILTFLFINKGENIEGFIKLDEKELRKTKQVNFPIDKDTMICEDKVIIGKFTKEDFSVMIIKDFEFSNMWRGIIKGIS